MGAYKRQMLEAAACQPWDDREYLRDQWVIEAESNYGALLLVQRQDSGMGQELRFAIATWHRLAGLAMKAEAEGSSNDVKNVIHRSIAACESQIQTLGG